jgi:hypothetical protein
MESDSYFTPVSKRNAGRRGETKEMKCDDEKKIEEREKQRKEKLERRN